MFSAKPEPIGAPEDAEQAHLISVGRIAFRYPGTLGGVAAREGMSCNTCHVNGDTSPHFFIAGLSSEPGTFDATNSVFSKETEDHIDNPLIIPSLFNVSKTAPYAQGDRFATLEAMLDHVVLDEFEGLKLPASIHQGLMTYLQYLESSDATANEDWPTLEKDLIELNEHIAALGSAIDRNADPDAVLFLFAAARHKIGRIAEFFPNEEEPRRVLNAWSSELRGLRKRFSANEDTDTVRAALGQIIYPEELQPHIQASLYNIDRLKSHLDAHK